MSALSDAANALGQDRWVEFPTNGWNTDLYRAYQSTYDWQRITEYGCKMYWDPTGDGNGGYMYYLGGPHPGYPDNCKMKYIRYKESNNTWEIVYNFPTYKGHTYCLWSFHPTEKKPYISQDFDYQNPSTTGLARFDGTEPFTHFGTGQLWTNGYKSLEWFPDQIAWIGFVGGYNYVHGIIERCDYVTKAWTTVADKTTVGDCLHSFAHYSKPTASVLCGGGNSETRFWRVNIALSVFDCTAADYSLGIGFTTSICDPVSGDLLCLRNNNTFRAYRIATNDWVSLNNSLNLWGGSYAKNNQGEYQLFGAIPARLGPSPAPMDGVVMLASSGAGKIYLYKYAPSTFTLVGRADPTHVSSRDFNRLSSRSGPTFDVGAYEV